MKLKTIFFCTQCGNETPKWQGKCPSCGQWNTLQEHIEKPAISGRAKPSNGASFHAPKYDSVENFLIQRL